MMPPPWPNLAPPLTHRQVPRSIMEACPATRINHSSLRLNFAKEPSGFVSSSVGARYSKAMVPNAMALPTTVM